MRPPFSFFRHAVFFFCCHVFFARKAGCRSEYRKNFKKNFIKNRLNLRFISRTVIPVHTAVCCRFVALCFSSLSLFSPQ
ncbi:hypothetical protein DESPIG_01422 [Desulfovibrio piger ATCC 29098]|uniref:Uncharacterized protein n=1 Tax=Desulfovibrio piger ATCC 29098 TaxID=411464 RepID=B6WTL6_9BACT|nr:hypothetical protein DESPIG_01422 [Desulfovibrio piger ATCC 29098]